MLMTPRQTVPVHRHMLMTSHESIIWVRQRRRALDAVESAATQSGKDELLWCSSGRRRHRLPTLLLLWQSIQRQSLPFPLSVTWASSSIQTWWCALMCVRRCRAVSLRCLNYDYAASAVLSWRPSSNHLSLLWFLAGWTMAIVLLILILYLNNHTTDVRDSKWKHNWYKH